MKKIHGLLFNELRSTAQNIAVGWKLTRTDGEVMGFTSSDLEFEYNGLTYLPTNSFAGSATVAKNNLSVDNMSVTSAFTAQIEDTDVRAGKYDNAAVEVFWIRPDRPDWGVIPIKGGKIGEITLRGNQFEAELRSVMQQLQQNVGDVYTMDCRVDQLGNNDCKVEMDAPAWAPGECKMAKIEGDAGVGDVVRPTVYNGFWYVCTAASGSVSSEAPSDEPPYTTAVTGPLLLAKVIELLLKYDLIDFDASRQKLSVVYPPALDT